MTAWTLARIGLALVIFAGYLVTLAPGLTWANGATDGGDLATAAVVDGVAHPTGYPTYLLLARLALLWPWGEPAFKLNLLSALCATCAALLVVGWVAAAARGPAPSAGLGPAQWGGLAAGAAFAWAPLVWGMAVVTEVYSLHLLFLAGLLRLIPLQPGVGAMTRVGWPAGLLFGLAVGNHVTVLLLLPAWLAAASRCWGFKRPRVYAAFALGLLAGLSVYGLISLRAAGLPPVSWGHAVDWAGFAWVALAEPYRGLAFAAPPAEVWERAAAWARLLSAQFGWPGLALAFGGLAFAPLDARLRWVTVWLVLVSAVFALGYNTTDAVNYLLPAVLGLALWLGLGVARALAAIGPRWAPPAAVGVLALLGLGALWTAPQVDASRDGRADAFGRGAMADLPAGALVFTRADRETFALWYFHFALGERPDLVLLVEPLLDFEWYQRQLPSLYPELHLPTAYTAEPRALVEALNPRPVCEAVSDPEPRLNCPPP